MKKNKNCSIAIEILPIMGYPNLHKFFSILTSTTLFREPSIVPAFSVPSTYNS
jgi:hypothetical protein